MVILNLTFDLPLAFLILGFIWIKGFTSDNYVILYFIFADAG